MVQRKIAKTPDVNGLIAVSHNLPALRFKKERDGFHMSGWVVRDPTEIL